MDTLNHIHGGNLREAAEKYGLDQQAFIDFSANINPLGFSSQVNQAILRALPDIIHYPDPQARLLRQRASEKFLLPETSILPGNGAIELLYLLVNLLKPKNALIPAPTFNEYEASIRIAGGNMTYLNLLESDDFRLHPGDLFNNWKKSDIIFICNPNNPTGVLTPRTHLLEIISEAEKLGKFIVVDEAFMDFVPERERFTVLDLVGKFENLFVLYSLTKFYAIPGLRLGLGFGHPELIKKLDQNRDPWNVNVLAQIAGSAALMDEPYTSETLRYVEIERTYLYEQVKSLEGFKAYEPTVNYILLNIEETGYTAGEMTDILGKQGILIRDCSSYMNLDAFYIRVAVKKRDENNKLIEAFRGIRRKSDG